MRLASGAIVVTAVAIGAGLVLRGTTGATVTGVVAHGAQDGISLVDATATYVADNDVGNNSGWAIQHLDDPSVRFVEVDVDTSAYDGGHLPGAINLPPERIAELASAALSRLRPR